LPWEGVSVLLLALSKSHDSLLSLVCCDVVEVFGSEAEADRAGWDLTSALPSEGVSELLLALSKPHKSLLSLS